MSASGGRPVRGLVHRGPGTQPVVEDLLLDEPGHGEVLVRMAAAGICHSDLHVVDGEWERPADVVMGHEGAGYIEALGPGVVERPADARKGAGGLRVGDLVALAWTAPCGRCAACRREQDWLCSAPLGGGHRRQADAVRLHRPDGSPLGSYLGVGTFCSAQVVAAEAAIAIDPRTPVGVAALIGCAATTGVGAVRSTADVRAGDSVVVIGLGGVGMAALMAARDATEGPVIGVDLEADKRAAALDLGATEATEPDRLLAVTSSLPSGGADHVFECIGLVQTAELALAATRAGGTTTLVGMTAMGQQLGIDVYDFVESGKRLLGSNYGSAIPARDFPAIAADVVSGRLPLARTIDSEIDLDAADRAFDAMRRREGGRRIIVFG